MAADPRRRRSRVARPTRRGWLIGIAGLAAVAAAYPSGRGELLSLGLFLTILPVVAWLSVRFRPLKFTVARGFLPPMVAVGSPSIVRLDVANLARFPSPAANWRDSWPWRPFASAPARLPVLGAHGVRSPGSPSAVRLQYEVRPSRRGLFDIGPFIIDFSDPFGLADGAVVAVGADTITVTPELVALPEGTVSIAADEGPTRLRQRRAYGGEDDLMTREYRQGDARRRVHWRASAHHGELMVRQEEQRSHAEARILLDTRRPSYRDARGPGAVDEAESESFEWAVGMCASLASGLAERGFLVSVIETGARQLAPADRPAEFLASLAAVQLTEERAERMSLLAGEARPDRSQGSVFAVVSAPDEPTVERLVSQRTSFDLAVAFLVDPWPSPLFEPLRAAGWICVPVHPDDLIEDAWLAAGLEQESLRGRG